MKVKERISYEVTKHKTVLRNCCENQDMVESAKYVLRNKSKLAPYTQPVYECKHCGKLHKRLVWQTDPANGRPEEWEFIPLSIKELK